MYVKCLSRPHLLEGRRYAIGLFVLVTSWEPLVVYVAKTGGVLYQDLFSPSFHTCAPTPIAHLQSILSAEAWTSLLSQASDFIIKLMLTYEKSVQLAQSRYSTSALRGCFEVIQVRFVVSEELKLKILDVVPCKWSTKDHFERSIIKSCLCDALAIKGLADCPSDDSAEVWFTEEITRRSQANTWERVFPLPSSARTYGAALSLASDSTQSLCKLVHSKKLR